MELKLKYVCRDIIATKLLIVPYGIETEDSCNRSIDPSGLLIVPYGIETIIL